MRQQTASPSSAAVAKDFSSTRTNGHVEVRALCTVSWVMYVSYLYIDTDYMLFCMVLVIQELFISSLQFWLLFFQHAQRESSEQSVLKCACATDSTPSHATAPQGHASARQDGRAGHAMMMLTSVICHLAHLQCVLITRCVPILTAVSCVSVWKTFTKLRMCASVKIKL